MHRKLTLATKQRIRQKATSTFVKGIHAVIGERNLVEEF